MGLSDGIRAGGWVAKHLTVWRWFQFHPSGWWIFVGQLVYGWFMALVSDIEPKAVDVSSPFNQSRS